MTDVAVLKNIPLFKGIQDDDFDVLSQVVSCRQYESGETIFQEGESGPALYIISAGTVKLLRNIRKGEEQTLAILKEGKFFGELSLFENKGHTATASTLRESELIVLDGDDFEKLSEANPKLGYLLLKRMALEVCTLLRDMDQKMIDMVKYVWEFGAKT